MRYLYISASLALLDLDFFCGWEAVSAFPTFAHFSTSLLWLERSFEHFGSLAPAHILKLSQHQTQHAAFIWSSCPHEAHVCQKVPSTRTNSPIAVLHPRQGGRLR